MKLEAIGRLTGSAELRRRIDQAGRGVRP